MKRNKIVFWICITIFGIIFFEIVSYMKESIIISELNNMYKDINILESKIALYYLDYGNLPIKQDRKIEFKEKSINPNDNDIYYEIDLSKIENLSLFYGNKNLGINDIYIINEQSHTVYYYRGCEYNNKIIYTRQIHYEYVEIDIY